MSDFDHIRPKHSGSEASVWRYRSVALFLAGNRSHLAARNAGKVCGSETRTALGRR